jgi:tRNA threonylcarbamoyladenosine biosynthesis protein TsaB
VIILALDSATSTCSLALWRDGTTLAARHVGAGGQGDALPLEVASLLAESGLTFDDVTRLAVTIGPGRFTGLRAGLAFMRGLALARALPLVGVTTLAAVAVAGAARGDELQLAVIDSKRAELFFQLFDAQGSERGAPFAARPDALAAQLPARTAIVVVGELAPLVAAELAGAGIAARAIERSVEAVDVARLAAGRAPPATSPAPLYIHPPATTAPRRAAAVAKA